MHLIKKKFFGDGAPSVNGKQGMVIARGTVSEIAKRKALLQQKGNYFNDTNSRL